MKSRVYKIKPYKYLRSSAQMIEGVMMPKETQTAGPQMMSLFNVVSLYC